MSRQEGQGEYTGLSADRPMWVAKILSGIHIAIDYRQFIEIVFISARLVEKEFPTLSLWGKADRLVEFLRHLPELSSYDSLLEPSAIYALKSLQRQRDYCQCVLF